MILTINSGSSSLKFQIYDWQQGVPLAVGLIERVGQQQAQLQLHFPQHPTLEEQRPCADHKQALQWGLDTLKAKGFLPSLKEIEAVGHRVLHGGETFRQSTLITPESLALFDSLVGLGPLHMPPALKGIRIAQTLLPDIPHAAVMDTAWHASIPPENYLYALPLSWYQERKVRRYGFHGTSFLYTAKRAAVLLGKSPQQTNLILIHLGNGASMCAVKNGLSHDTSMGLTPLEGLVMGTRCGDVDPAAILHIMDRLQLSPQQMTSILNQKSGLIGLTGLSDRRDIIAQADKGDLPCQQALAIECQRIKKYIGAYFVQLERVDAVVFTAGVGEMSPRHRALALAGTESLGIVLDTERNKRSRSRNCETRISADHSSVPVFIIPTDEELVMTEDALAIKEGRYCEHTQFQYSFQSRNYVNRVRQAAFAQDLHHNPYLNKIVAKPPAN